MPEPQPVSDDAQQLADTIANARMSTLQAAFRILGWPITVQLVEDNPESGQQQRRGGVTEQHLWAVAKAYDLAVSEGRPPTVAVAELFGASHSTAARWVGRARSCGLLGATTAGKASRAGSEPTDA